MDPTLDATDPTPQGPWFEGLTESISGLPGAAHTLALGALGLGLVLWLFGRRATRPAFLLGGILAGGATGFLLAPALGFDRIAGAPSPYVGLGVGGVAGVLGAAALFRLTMIVGASAVFTIFGLLGGACYVQLVPGTTSAPTEQSTPTTQDRAATPPPDEPARAQHSDHPRSATSDRPIPPSDAKIGPSPDEGIATRDRPPNVLASPSDRADPPEFEWPEPDWSDDAPGAADLTGPVQRATREILERDVLGPPVSLARELPDRLRREARTRLDPEARRSLHSAADRVLAFLDSLHRDLTSLLGAMTEDQQFLVGGATLAGTLLGALVGMTMPRRSAALVTALGGAALWLSSAVWLAHAMELPGREMLHRSPLAWTVIWLGVSVIGATYQLTRSKRAQPPTE